MKLMKKANNPKIAETHKASEKLAIKFPLIILVKYSVGLTMPRNSPELSLDAKVPLIFPLISKNPGKRISIPGINKNFSPCDAIAVPAIIPPIREID